MTDYITTHPRARKEHRCEACTQHIRKGEIYTRRITFDGTAYTFKNCDACDETIDQMFLEWSHLDGWFTPDDLDEWAQESTSENAMFYRARRGME